MNRENFEAQKEVEAALVRQAYDGLIEALKQTPELTVVTPQKISIAWLIERMKIENPLGWQDDVNALKENVVAARERGGKFEVSHFISGLIDQKYLAFLETMLGQEADERARRNLEIMIKMTKDNIKFCRQAKEKGSAVSFGGVSRDFIPDWYFSVEK